MNTTSRPKSDTVFLPGQREFQVGGPLGNALRQSHEGRLRSFVVDTASAPLALFTEDAKRGARSGDWYGEHVGKWMIAAIRAARRTGDLELADRVAMAADTLCQAQEENGYLGTYAKDAKCRFTHPDVESERTWDVWVHACSILGLLEAYRNWPNDDWLNAAHRAAELIYRVFVESGRDITRQGNHHGLSSLIILHSLAELSLVTGRGDYAEWARRLAEQAEARPELRPIEKLLAGQDVATIGTGKAYQIAWLLLGYARLFEATGRPEYLAAAKAGWFSIREHHLTLGGGPWGGLGRHKEVFNDAGDFSPYGLVETCSAMAWMQLNRALHGIDPTPAFIDEIEKTLFNTILGAMDPNGEDWCYFTFPNGRRNLTYSWACCKSSGAMALEEAALLVGEGERLDCPWAGTAQRRDSSLTVEVMTNYPFDPNVRFQLTSAEGTLGKIALRIPEWAIGSTVNVNGQPAAKAIPGQYMTLELGQASQATIEADFPMPPEAVAAAETRDHHGQEIVHRDYFALRRGPVVYATGLLDGYKTEETLRAPKLDLARRIEVVEARSGSAPTLLLQLIGRPPLEFRPYFEADGRSPGAWRATWMGVAWQ